jgi:hypothetical protein
LAVKVSKSLPDWDIGTGVIQLDDLTRLTIHRRHYYGHIGHDTQKQRYPTDSFNGASGIFFPIFGLKS